MAASSQDSGSFEELFKRLTDRKNNNQVPLCKPCSDRHKDKHRNRRKPRRKTKVAVAVAVKTDGTTSPVGVAVKTNGIPSPVGVTVKTDGTTSHVGEAVKTELIIPSPEGVAFIKSDGTTPSVGVAVKTEGTPLPVEEEVIVGLPPTPTPADFLCQTCGITLCMKCAIDKQHILHDKQHLKRVFYDMFNAASTSPGFIRRDHYRKKISATSSKPKRPVRTEHLMKSTNESDADNNIDKSTSVKSETVLTSRSTQHTLRAEPATSKVQTFTAGPATPTVSTSKSKNTSKSDEKISKADTVTSSSGGSKLEKHVKQVDTSEPQSLGFGTKIAKPKPSEISESASKSDLVRLKCESTTRTARKPVNYFESHLGNMSVVDFTLFHPTNQAYNTLVVPDLYDIKWPYGLCTSSDGSVFISDTYNQRLKVIRDSVAECLYPSNEVLYPCGIACLDNTFRKTIVVADSGNGNVKQLDRRGELVVQTIDGQLTRPHGVATTDWSCWFIYVTDISKRTITKHSVVTAEVVQTFSGPGKSSECQMKQPSYIDCSKDGRSVFVTDSSGGCVKVYDNRSNTSVKTFTSFGVPQGICIGPQENTLIVADFARSSVDVLDLRNGAKVTQVACSNRGVIGPTDVAYHTLSRRVLVLDTTRGRVLEFPILPQIPKDNQFDESHQRPDAWLSTSTPSIVFQSQN